MHKAKASQIHAASSDAAIGGAKYEPGFDDDGNEADPESRKMTARKTPVGMISPSISFNGATTISTGNKLQSTVTTTVEMVGSTVNSALGGGGNQSIGASVATATGQFYDSTPTSVTSSTLPSIDWNALVPSTRIGSGAFSAVCK